MHRERQNLKNRLYMKSLELKINYMEYDSLDELSTEDRELAQAALDAIRGAYSPYSHFNVGAAVRLSTGEIVIGANQENIAFPSGLCAERTAMFHAGATRPDAAMSALAVAAEQDGKVCAFPATPCGACRQVMAQYQARSGKPMEVLLVGSEKIWKFSRVDDILPFIFDSLK